MRPVAAEMNIESLRQYTLLVEKRALELAAENARLKKLSAEAAQDSLSEEMRDQYSRLKTKFFSAGRESTREDRPPGHVDEKLKLHGEYAPEELKAAKEKSFLRSLDETYRLGDDMLAAESKRLGINLGAEAWEEIPGWAQESKEITVLERIYQQVIIKQVKYRLRRDLNRTGKDIIITATGPVKVKPGSKYSLDFALEVVADKYGFHIPLERQRRKMEGAGLDVDVKTLYGLCEGVAEHCWGMHKKILADVNEEFAAVHVDESPWPIQGKDSNGYMWAVSNRRGAVYRFEPTRSGKVAEELLKARDGSVLTDGFSGYNRLKKNPSLRVGACWSHARREFFERLDDYPNEAREALKFIDELFEIEAKPKCFDELREFRRTESRAVLGRYRNWLMETASKNLSQSGLRKAINYSLKFWPELTRFAEDLSLPLSNNDAERALRHVVMGRKNFNGSKTINGADTAAAIYTVIESAKRNRLQPKVYLKYLLEARWFGREPLTPYAYAIEQFGMSKKVIFPEKADWKI
jgi:transposase